MDEHNSTYAPRLSAPVPQWKSQPCEIMGAHVCEAARRKTHAKRVKVKQNGHASKKAKHAFRAFVPCQSIPQQWNQNFIELTLSDNAPN